MSFIGNHHMDTHIIPLRSHSYTQQTTINTLAHVRLLDYSQEACSWEVSRFRNEGVGCKGLASADTTH